jgi:hypothetical protein
MTWKIFNQCSSLFNKYMGVKSIIHKLIKINMAKVHIILNSRSSSSNVLPYICTKRL